jgi:hypothetical protein
MSYDAITFPFQVHNDAKRVERAYLVPEGLPYGATLEVSPSQSDIAPGHAAIFSCRLTLDRSIIRPGCENDQGFRLTAWRIADDADERWGSCFYFIRPRVRTTLVIQRADWYESQLTIYGALGLATDTTVTLASQLPLRVRIRLDVRDALGKTVSAAWVNVNVQPGGSFMISRKDFKGPVPAELHVQAWFDRTDLLASSRSPLVTVQHQVAPVIN